MRRVHKRAKQRILYIKDKNLMLQKKKMRANNHEEGHLKQMQSSLKWNLELKPSSNIYTIFDMIFEELFMFFSFSFCANYIWF